MIEDWYCRQSDAVQAALDTAMEYLVQRGRNEWHRPHFAALSGKLREIGEIRLTADKTEHRVLGFCGPHQAEFTLLIGTSKKGRNYDPRNALETVLGRMAEVKSDGRRSCVCKLWD